MILQENTFCTGAQGMTGTQHFSLLHRAGATMLLHVSSEIRRCCHQRHFVLPFTGVGWCEVIQWMQSSPGENLDLLLPSPASASPFPIEHLPFSGAPGAPVSSGRGKSMETKAEKLGAACQVSCGPGLTAASLLVRV